MRGFWRILVFSIILLLSVQLTSCKSQARPTIPTVSGTPAVSAAASTPKTVDQARQDLQENGHTTVASAQTASEVVGYPIAIPTFLPQGFSAQSSKDSEVFGIVSTALGNPPSVTPIDKSPQVVLFFARLAVLPSPIPSNEPYMTLNETPDDVGEGGGTPIDINGHAGTRMLLPTDVNNSAPTIYFRWSDGTLHYMLAGRLVAPLDEATVLKVANSVVLR